MQLLRNDEQPRYIDCTMCLYADRKNKWCDGWDMEIPYVKLCEKFVYKPDEEVEAQAKKSLEKYKKYMRK